VSSLNQVRGSCQWVSLANMAVPTLASVTPASGPSCGSNVVTLAGTNFNLPVIAYSIPQEALTPTVAVTVGGTAVKAARVISATEVRLWMPRYRGATAHLDATNAARDIVLTNMDAATGLAIPGETATLASAYTYERWQLGPPRKDPPLLDVHEAFLRDLLIDISRSIGVAVHVDYDEEGTAVRTKLADLPAIGLRVTASRDYAAEEGFGPTEVERMGGDGWDEYWGEKTYALVYDVTLIGEGQREAFHLEQAIRDFVDVNPVLEVDADPDLYPGETSEYPVEIMRDAVQASTPNDSAVQAFQMQLRVRGISVMPDEPVRQLKEITEFIIGWTDLTAASVSEHTYP